MKTSVYLLSLALSLFAAQTLASATAYKCTSESGDVSFLDKKPTLGCVRIELVNIADGTAVDANAAAETDAEDPAEKDKREMAEREEKAKQECEKRSKELEILRNKPRVVMTDPKTGEKKTLSQEEHQAKIREYEKYVSVVCAPPQRAAETTTDNATENAADSTTEQNGKTATENTTETSEE